MKKIVIKFGLYGLSIALILFLIALTFGSELDYSTQEIIGYLTILASLSFVFLGIKHFRDNENNGELSLGKAVLVGLLIAAFTAVGIASADYIYTSSINPDFFEEYKAMMEAQGHTGEIPEYSSGFMALIMFITVIVIGLVVAVISGLILRTKK